ncbi:MAG: redoxin domain-containing protein [Bacillota bacterium]
MKKALLVLLILASNVFAQSKPVSGEKFTVTYDPALKGILNNSNEITLVYTFDYWGTLPSAPDSPSDLFKNVETPDSGKAVKQLMTKDGKLYKTSIEIPQKASLLSYYFTSGSKSDYNDNKTYVSYIYDKNMKPVRNARFSNIDFMVMAGRSLDDQIKELSMEIKDYPDNFTARFAYWNKKMDNIKDFNILKKMPKEIEKYYGDLKKKYKDNYDIMNVEARTYDQYRYYVSRMYGDEYQKIEKIYKELIFKIPVEKMSSSIRRSYDIIKRNEENQKFNESIVGKPAPEFEFETIKGEKMKLSDFRGKIVLLDFWGTWCGPCVGEIPNLKNAYKQFKDKGFEIISISSDLINGRKDKEYLKKFTDEKEMSWNHVLDAGMIHAAYKINHWPTLYLIDKDGKIIRNETSLRGSSLEKTLGEVLQAASM